jgi:plastocyanin
MTRLVTSLGALAAAAAFAAGCGSSSNDGGTGSAGGGGGYGAPAQTSASTAAAPASSAAAGGALTLAADESGGLSFDRKTLSAKAGTVTITMSNPDGDSQPHAIAVQGPGGVDQQGAVAQPGGTSKVSLKLAPGTYTYYCPVDGHRSAGMEGTLTVR